MSKLIVVLGFSGLLGLITALCGCAGQTPEVKLGHALAIGGATLSCVEGEAPLVENAIVGGATDWIAILIEGIGCIPSIVKSIMNASKAAVASAGTSFTLPAKYDDKVKRRALIALKMYQALKP